MFSSIRWRIAIPYVLLILLVMLGLGGYLSAIVRQNYMDHLDAQLSQLPSWSAMRSRPL